MGGGGASVGDRFCKKLERTRTIRAVHSSRYGRNCRLQFYGRGHCAGGTGIGFGLLPRGLIFAKRRFRILLWIFRIADGALQYHGRQILARQGGRAGGALLYVGSFLRRRISAAKRYWKIRMSYGGRRLGKHPKQTCGSRHLHGVGGLSFQTLSRHRK